MGGVVADVLMFRKQLTAKKMELSQTLSVRVKFLILLQFLRKQTKKKTSAESVEQKPELSTSSSLKVDLSI